MGTSIMHNLVLFDIDSTLTHETKSHKRAFSEAFKKVYGLSTSIDVINYQGMTDQQIIFEVMKKIGIKEELIKRKINECMREMVRIFNDKLKDEEIKAIEGVPELLKTLHKSGVYMGLVTGNLEEIGRSKLKKVGLNHYFKIGGFGSDDIDRTKLVRLAIKKAQKKFKVRFKKNILLIGDTPLDIKAGKQAAIHTIGVTTGAYTKEQLKKAGADFIISNPRYKKEVLEILKNTS